MTHRQPLPGTPVSELDTPCLIVDLDALTHNIGVIARRYEGTGVQLRPHAKNHKSPVIAALQMRAGNTVGGVCAAKVSEAEAMVNGGVRSVLVANQIASPAKARRLAALAARAEVIAAVDAPEHVRLLGDAARDAGVTLGAVIEVNTSMRRAGIRAVEQAPPLAKLIAETAGLRFRGIMSHQTISGFPSREERYKVGGGYFARVMEVKTAIEQAGVPVEIVSTGETWTYDVAADTPGVTEVEGGTYVFMEMGYDYMTEFRIAGRVLGTIVSVPEPGLAIGDVTVEAIGAPNGTPSVEGMPGVRVRALTHRGTVLESDGRTPLRPGERYTLLTHQQDVTMNRWDEYVVVRDGVVVDVWPVAARGRHH
ncbi:MAG: DSD1 family PLP-dependent enzyme [SAR202 cluster bacterium]|nr:DSD1 family PLP-dependent enzyme [SAR202 cluster bacterium]